MRLSSKSHLNIRHGVALAALAMGIILFSSNALYAQNEFEMSSNGADEHTLILEEGAYHVTVLLNCGEGDGSLDCRVYFGTGADPYEFTTDDEPCDIGSGHHFEFYVVVEEPTQFYYFNIDACPNSFALVQWEEVDPNSLPDPGLPGENDPTD